MGWLGNLLETVRHQPVTDWTYIEELAESESNPSKKIAGRAFTVDDCYVEVWIEGFRLSDRRRWATTFVPSTYASMTLARQGSDPATLTKLSGGNKEMSADDRDRVISPSTRVLSAMPWRGGALELELAVFAVKTGNLVAPVLNYVTKVASKAGISLASAVDPFLPLITEGLDLIAGSTEDTEVEIAIDTDMTLTTSRISAVIAQPKSISLRNISYDPTDHKLLTDGVPLQAGYCVFSIRQVPTNADWGSIEPVKKAWDAIRDAALDGDDVRVAAALQMFRRQVTFCPDLIKRDKDSLIRLAEQHVEDTKTPAGAGFARTIVPDYAALNLYGDVST